MATFKNIPGSGYGNPYVDSLIWGGNMWDQSQEPILISLAGENDYDEAVQVHGYFVSPERPRVHPTVLDVLGPEYAANEAHGVHIDNSVLEDCKVEEKEAEKAAKAGLLGATLVGNRIEVLTNSTTQSKPWMRL